MGEWKKMFSQITRLEVRSVTDSLFKYGLLVLLMGAGSAFSGKDWVTAAFLGIGGLMILFGAIFYWYFAVNNPDYLRSETYHLKKQAFEMLGDNERANNRNLDKIPPMMNPYHKQDDMDGQNPLLK